MEGIGRKEIKYRKLTMELSFTALETRWLVVLYKPIRCTPRIDLFVLLLLI